MKRNNEDLLAIVPKISVKKRTGELWEGTSSDMLNFDEYLSSRLSPILVGCIIIYFISQIVVGAACLTV